MYTQYTRADGAILHVVSCFAASLVAVEKMAQDQKIFMSAGFELADQEIVPLACAKFKAEVALVVSESKAIIAQAQSDVRRKKLQAVGLARLIPEPDIKGQHAQIKQGMALLDEQFEQLLAGHTDLMTFARAVGVEAQEEPKAAPKPSDGVDIKDVIQLLRAAFTGNGVIMDSDGISCDNPECPVHGSEIKQRMTEEADIARKQMH